MKSRAKLRSLATHSLVVALFVNPYLLFVLTDIYRLTVSDTSPVPTENSLVHVMATISFAALLVSLSSFLAAGTKRSRLAIVAAVALVIIGWFLSQLIAPLGFITLAIAAGVIVYGTAPTKRR